MALNSNPFVEGIDPTATFGGYASVLLQLIRQAQPSSTYGMILFDTATPDVTGANAWRKRCVWVNLTDPNIPTVNVYKEGTSPGWVNVQAIIPANTITTAMIQNAAVTLAKLSVSGGTANQLIRVNATGTAFEFVSLSSLVTSGSIPVSSLITAGIPAGQFRLAGTYGPGVATWYNAQQVIDNLSNAAIASDYIAPAPGATARSQFLSTRTGDPYGTWRYFDPSVDIQAASVNGDRLVANSVPVSKLTPGAATEGSYLGIVGGVPDWIPPFPVVKHYETPVASYAAIPAVGGKVEFTHGLGGNPESWRIGLICVNTDPSTGYDAGDFIPVESLMYGTGEGGYCSGFVNTTKIGFVRQSFVDTIHVLKKGTGAQTSIPNATTDWKVKAYAIKIA